MPLSMYDVSVPLFVRMLTQLSGVLGKAAAHVMGADAAGTDAAALLGARLAPDMWSVAEQVRAAVNFPVRLTARLAGLPIPQFEGRDDSFAALQDRVAWALAFVQGVDRSAIDGTEDKPITFPSGDVQNTLSGRQYLLTFALPNFYFHLTAVYCILRHEGVPLVKEDWLGKI